MALGAPADRGSAAIYRVRSGSGADDRAAPSGLNTAMIFRRRNELEPRRSLHICDVCGVDTVNPVSVESIDDFHWCVLMRCGACGARTEAVLSNEVAARYDEELDRGWRKIRRAAEALEEENMAEWASSFITALDRDLIDAGDFSLAHDH
jgi:hypothetical protein